MKLGHVICRIFHTLNLVGCFSTFSYIQTGSVLIIYCLYRRELPCVVCESGALGRVLISPLPVEGAGGTP